MLNWTLYLNERHYIRDSISNKYPIFHSLSANDMILFLFNNVDPFVSKKLCHSVFLAFEKCESRTLNIAAIYKVRIVRVIIAIIIREHS